MDKLKNNDLVVCPYDPHHVIDKLRIQKHINKCQKNHPSTKLATCLYNYTHRVKPEELLNHYEICPQKKRIEVTRFYEQLDDDESKFNLPTTPFKNEENFYRLCQFPSDHFIKGVEQKKVTENVNTSSESNSSEITSVIPPNSHDKDNVVVKPLPLPKTVSKAFSSIKLEEEKSPDSALESSTPVKEPMQLKNISTNAVSKPMHEGNQPSSSGMQQKTPMLKKQKNSKLSGRFQNSNYASSRIASNCAPSRLSSYCDDSTTFISEDNAAECDSEICYNKETDVDDNIDEPILEKITNL